MNFLVKVGKILSGDTSSTHLESIPLKRSKGQKVDYVDPNTVLGLRLKTAISRFFENISGGTPLRNDPLKRYVHVNIDIEESLSTEIKKAYGSPQDPDENHKLRLEDAQNFLKLVNKTPNSLDDPQGLKRIIKNRNLIMDLHNILYEMGDTGTGVKMIQKTIQNLATQNSQNVIQLDDGSSTFCVSGGNHKNPVCFEFKRNNKGQYFLIIHNRFAEAPNNDYLIEGQTTKFEFEGRTYGKTSIAIQFEDSSKLSDKDFLRALFNAEKSGSTEEAYKIIKEHLLRGENPGIVVQDLKELELQECQKKIKLLEKKKKKSHIDSKTRSKELTQLRRKEKNLIKYLLKKDPSFNTFAAFYSAESNFSPSEQGMATFATRQKLRHYTIQVIVDQIVAKTFVNTQAEDAAEIIQHHKNQIPDSLQ